MTRREMMGVLASIGAVALSGCGRRYPAYRYRMTVEVDTPQGLRTGSSVIEVSTSGGSNPLGMLPWTEVHSQVRGEAVAVDVAPRKTLFALLQSSSGNVDAAAAYAPAGLPPSIKRDGDNASVEDMVELVKRTDVGVIDPKRIPNYYPLLVTFTDIADPKTVARVDPADLAASFGPGVKLKRITVQITDDPVTMGIEKRLGWLNTLDSYRTDPSNPFTNTLPAEIGSLRSN